MCGCVIVCVCVCACAIEQASHMLPQLPTRSLHTLLQETLTEKYCHYNCYVYVSSNLHDGDGDDDGDADGG